MPDIINDHTLLIFIFVQRFMMYKTFSYMPLFLKTILRQNIISILLKKTSRLREIM